jgi:ribosomal-protein-alanine N-acetyltransferase
LAAIGVIQAASSEASQWEVSDYLQYFTLVADTGGDIAGFLVARPVDHSECDLLNLAVAPSYRRQGIGRALIRGLFESRQGTIFLEVRESNQAARALYKSMGFQEVKLRLQYYQSPPESGIVMKFFS